MKRLDFALLFFLLPVISGLAQTDYLTFVTKDGAAALQKSDVTVKIEGKDAPVTDVVLIDTTKRTDEIRRHPAGRRLYLFVFDFMHLKPEEVVQARKIVQAFTGKIATDDLISVAGITATDGLKVFCSPTADRDKIWNAMNSFGMKKVTGLIEGPEGNYYSELFSTDAKPVEPLPEAALIEQIKSYAIAEKDKKEMRPVYLQSIADLGFVLSVLQGRKNVILFTPGVDAGGLSINLPLRQKTAKKKDVPETVSIEQHDDLDSITDTSYERVQARATMGPRRKPQKQSSEALPDLFAGSDSHVFVFHWGTQEHDIIKKLATKTNGLFLKDVSTPDAAIDQILATDSTYYAVGFRASDELKDLNGFKLDVKGREAIAPAFFLLPKTAADYSTNERKMKIAEAMYKDAAKPPAMYRFWTDFSFQKGNVVVPAFVQVDGPSILKTKVTALDIEFFAYALSPKGSVLDYSYFLVSLDLNNKSLQDKLSKSGVKVWNPLLASKGPVAIRWIIMNNQTGEIMTHSSQVEVQDASMTMSQPFFPSMNLNWIMWPNPLQSIDKRGAQVSYPYRAGGDMYFSPDITPVLKSTESGQVVFFRVYNMNSGGMPNFGLRLQDTSGQQHEIKQVALLQKPNQEEQKGMAFFWKLQSLPQVAPGNYRLKIATLDPAQNQEISREVTTEIK